MSSFFVDEIHVLSLLKVEKPNLMDYHQHLVIRTKKKKGEYKRKRKTMSANEFVDDIKKQPIVSSLVVK